MTHHIRARWWLPLFLAALVLACQASGDLTTPVPTSPLQEALPTAADTRGQPLAGRPLAGVTVDPLPQFAEWQRPEVRDLPGTAFSGPFPILDRINNPADLWPLNEAQRRQLRDAGYVIQPASERFFHDIYLEAAADGRPIIVTPDIVLHATRLILADVWADVENGQLRDDLSVLAASMADASQGQWAIAPPSLRPAAAHVTAYFAVAAVLLDSTYPVPESVAATVAEELILIKQGAGTFQSPLFGITQDYARFRPPAGYASPAARAAYFQAAEWLSSMRWRFDGTPEQARQNGLRLLFLLDTLERSQNWTRWQRIASTHAYFLGWPSTWTLADYGAVARQNFDGQLPDSTVLGGPNQLDSYLLTLQANGAVEAQTLHFTPIGQWPDGDVLTGVTFNRVGLFRGDPLDPPRSAANTEVGLIRAFPLTLDVAAAFGSDEAVRMLNASSDSQYEGYSSQLAALTSSPLASDLTSTFNGAWVNALAPLFQPPGGATPLYMRQRDWHKVQLSTWAGGWTEMRRDATATAYRVPDPTIFAPDPAALPAATAYLAPEPELYAGLVATSEQLRRGLAARGLLAAESDERLSQLSTILARLQLLAEQELAGVALRSDEERFLRQVVPELLGLTMRVDGHASEVAMLATLYADPNSGQIWRIGLGAVQPIYVLVPEAGGYAVAVGGVNSLYGFAEPAGSPTNIGSWLLGNRPEQLSWRLGLVTP